MLCQYDLSPIYLYIYEKTVSLVSTTHMYLQCHHVFIVFDRVLLLTAVKYKIRSFIQSIEKKINVTQ